MANSSLPPNQLISKVRRFVLSEQEILLNKIGRKLFTSTHIPLVVKLSKKILKTRPEADKNITVLGAWLHDVGHLCGNFAWPNPIDHAIIGEKETWKILQSFGTDKETIEKVCHIVRSHRNRDVAPSTIEAKIVAAADSAAHFFGETYKTIIKEVNVPLKERATIALEKLERDWKDVSVFPELAEQLKEKYTKNKKLLEAILAKS